jgi:hypothetical protein
MLVAVFWAVTWCDVGGGGSTLHRNDGNLYIQGYVVSDLEDYN